LLCARVMYNRYARIIYVTQYYISVPTEIISRWNLADALQWRLWESDTVARELSVRARRADFLPEGCSFEPCAHACLTQFQNAPVSFNAHLACVQSVGFVVPISNRADRIGLNIVYADCRHTRAVSSRRLSSKRHCIFEYISNASVSLFRTYFLSRAAIQKRL